MGLNKIMLAAAMVLGASTMANAANQGKGQITFTGSIVDAPCSIAPDSIDQTVDMGEIATVALKDGGKSAPRQFDIKLEKCDISTMKTVTATFNGKASTTNPDLLGIIGSASGAGIALTDMASKTIKLGTATDPQKLDDQNNTLRFAAYLQGDGDKEKTVVPGEFTSTADFTLAYQ